MSCTPQGERIAAALAGCQPATRPVLRYICPPLPIALHVAYLRRDGLVPELLGIRRAAGQSTLSRFFAGFTSADADLRCFQALWNWGLHRLPSGPQGGNWTPFRVSRAGRRCRLAGVCPSRAAAEGRVQLLVEAHDGRVEGDANGDLSVQQPVTFAEVPPRQHLVAALLCELRQLEM